MSDPRQATKIPVPAWGAVISTACLIIGWNWDVSWHRSIGRDTLWTLPHIAIYVALGVAIAYNSWLVLSYTFGKSKGLPSVRVFGFNGPSATFVTLWGCLMQLTGIVFDDYWHAVYGLDIGVFSPAHAVLGFGILVFYFGQFALVGWYYNAAPPALKRKLFWLLLLIWSFFLGNPILSMDPAYGPLAVRSAAFVISTAVFYPALLVMIDEFMDWRWSAAAAAALYMAGIIVMMQVFQLFPATPRFGPVYHDVPNFLPPAFPLALVVPAFAISWVRRRLRGKSFLVGLVGVGATFVLVFTATNWLTSAFMRSPWAENRFFGGIYPGGFFEEEFRFVPVMEANAGALLAIAIAIGVACASAWFGRRAGIWMKRVVR